MVQLSHPYMTTGKTIALTRQTFVGKIMSLLFNMLPRLVIAFLPRNKRLLISWLQSPSAVILEPKKIKSLAVSTVTPPTCHEVMGPDAMILVFCMLHFKPAFSFSSFTFIKKPFSSSSLSAIKVVTSAYLVVDIYPGNLDSSLCFIEPNSSHNVFCIFYILYSHKHLVLDSWTFQAGKILRACLIHWNPKRPNNSSAVEKLLMIEFFIS